MHVEVKGARPRECTRTRHPWRLRSECLAPPRRGICAVRSRRGWPAMGGQANLKPQNSEARVQHRLHVRTLTNVRVKRVFDGVSSAQKA